MGFPTDYLSAGEGILQCMRSMYFVAPVEEEVVTLPVRLKVDPFVISMESFKLSGEAVPAHDLEEYVNTFYKITAREIDDGWLRKLIDVGKGDNKNYDIT